MSNEKQKVYEKIQKDFQEDTVAGYKLKKDTPLLATNLDNPKHLDFIFNEYKKEGLIPEKFNNAEELTGYLQRRLHAEMDGIIKKDASIKGDKKFKKAYFKKRKKEILEKLVQDEAISKLKPSQRTPEQLKQISKMRWTGLPITVNADGDLKYHRRYFQDKVSQRVIDFANNIESGLGDKWAKEMRASWNEIGETNKAIKSSSGLSFDIGHFIPSILDGPNVGLNAASELSSPNRSKGGTPFTDTKGLARQLAIPENWMQAFTDWHLRNQGLDPNQLPRDYQLKGYQVVDAASGYSDPNAEIAKNQAKYKTDQELIDVVEHYKKQNIIPPETTVIGDGTKNPQITSIDDIKKYSSAERAVPGFEIKNGKVVKKVIQPSKSQEILKVIRNGNGNGNGIRNNIKNGKQIFESVIGGKVVKETIDATSKVLGKIPKPVRRVGAALPVVGAISDGSAIAGAVFDQNESVEQQKINDMHAISGGLGLTGFVFPPAWIPSTMMWGLAEMKQWQLNRKEQKAKDLELYYMTSSVHPKDEEGNLVTPEWGSGKRTWQDRLYARRGVR